MTINNDLLSYHRLSKSLFGENLDDYPFGVLFLSVYTITLSFQDFFYDIRSDKRKT